MVTPSIMFVDSFRNKRCLYVQRRDFKNTNGCWRSFGHLDFIRIPLLSYVAASQCVKKSISVSCIAVLKGTFLSQVIVSSPTTLIG